MASVGIKLVTPPVVLPLEAVVVAEVVEVVMVTLAVPEMLMPLVERELVDASTVAFKPPLAWPVTWVCAEAKPKKVLAAADVVILPWAWMMPTMPGLGPVAVGSGRAVMVPFICWPLEKMNT